MTDRAASPRRGQTTAAAFILGSLTGGVLAGAVGGLLGAGLALAALAIARCAWPQGLRATLVALILVGGFGALWVGSGVVRATLGLIDAGRRAPPSLDRSYQQKDTKTQSS